MIIINPLLLHIITINIDMFTTLIHSPIDIIDNIVIIVIIITNPSLSSFIPMNYH